MDIQRTMNHDNYQFHLVDKANDATYWRSTITPPIRQRLCNIPLRFFTSIYSFCRPGATQAMFAEKLNISPMTLSRALSADSCTKEDWIDPIFMMFLEQDTNAFKQHTELFLSQMDKICAAKNRFATFTAVCNYLKQNNDHTIYELEDFNGKNSFYLLDNNTGKKWLFYHYNDLVQPDGCGVDLLFDKMDHTCVRLGITKVTLITKESSAFEQLIGKFFLYARKEINKLRINRTIMRINPDNSDDITEYILTKEDCINP